MWHENKTRKQKPLENAFPPEINEQHQLIGYARVSTEDQRLDMQIDALVRYGVDVGSIYIEKISATSNKRFQLDLAIKSLGPGDRLVVYRLDRLARNMTDLLKRMTKIEDAGATFISLSESFDTKTPAGKLMFHVLGALAQFERDLTAERTKSGMASQKARGVHVGRPRAMTDEKIAKAVKWLEKDHMGVREVARRLHVSPTVIYQKFEISRTGTGSKLRVRVKLKSR